MRVARNFGDTCDKEVEEHNTTHLPHRLWLPVCVQTRGEEEPHRKVREHSWNPTVSMVCNSFGVAPTEEDEVAMIVVENGATRCVAAHACEYKGSVERVCDGIDQCSPQ